MMPARHNGCNIAIALILMHRGNLGSRTDSDSSLHIDLLRPVFPPRLFFVPDFLASVKSTLVDF
jgi:hypothetical protein